MPISIPARIRRDSPFYGFSINVNSSNDDFPGAPTPPGSWFDGHCGQPPNPNQITIAQAGIVAPATTIWYYDSNASIFQDGLTTWADLQADAVSWPAGAKSLEIDGSETIGQLFQSGGSLADNDPVIHDPMRHGNGLNISWCDGHVKWLKPSAIKGEWWSIEQVPQPVE